MNSGEIIVSASYNDITDTDSYLAEQNGRAVTGDTYSELDSQETMKQLLKITCQRQ
jgi:hypothetical protein